MSNFRSSKRLDENRLVSPTGQRRNVPVSVFVPAKPENKHPAHFPSSSTSSANDSSSTNNCESQLEPKQISYSTRSSTGDSSYTSINNENDMNNKLSTMHSTLKTSTENILDELSLTNDKHDNINKKMNVFERLFRGHKKKL